MAAVQVEIWSDVVCPWCYIGKRRFEAALARYAGAAEVNVVYRPYQLDPTAPSEDPRPVEEVYARKFGGPQEAQRLVGRVTALAAEDGIEFRLDRAVRANTLDAHRLLWLAEPLGIQPALNEALLEAYFTNGENVADADVLVRLAGSVGLPAERVRRLLDSDEGLGEVREQLALAASHGITAVPTFVVDGRWSIPGAQDVDTFVRVLEKLGDEAA